MEEISLEDYKRVFRELTIKEERRGFISHLLSYLFFNTFLILINLFYYPEKIWCLWPLLMWGWGVLIHYFTCVRWIEKSLKDREMLAEAKVRINKNKGGESYVEEDHK